MSDEQTPDRPEAPESLQEAPPTEMKSGKKSKAEKKRAAQAAEEEKAPLSAVLEASEANQPAVAAAPTDRPGVEPNGSMAMAQSLFEQGVQALLRGEYDDAENHYRQALNLRRKLGDKTGQVATLEQLGHLYYLRGSQTQAQEYYQQADQMRGA